MSGRAFENEQYRMCNIGVSHKIRRPERGWSGSTVYHIWAVREAFYGESCGI